MKIRKEVYKTGKAAFEKWHELEYGNEPIPPMLYAERFEIFMAGYLYSMVNEAMNEANQSLSK